MCCIVVICDFQCDCVGIWGCVGVVCCGIGCCCFVVEVLGVGDYGVVGVCGFVVVDCD